jgi:DNA-binding CsgD family transcriptional regulator
MTTGEHGARSLQTLKLVEDLLEMPALRPLGRCEPADLGRALHRAECALRGTLHRTPAPDQPTRRAGLRLALEQVRALRTELRAAPTPIAEVREAVTRLRPLTSATQLLRMAPAEAGTLGYTRVLVSRLESWTWLPCAAFAAQGGDTAAGMVRAGSQRPRRLNGTLRELDMVRARRPILVPDAQRDPRVHPELVSYTHTVRYVAAPLVSGDRVVGLLHADKADAGEVRDADQELLGLFAESLGQALERAALNQRLRRVHAQLRSQRAALDELLEELDDLVPVPDDPEAPETADERRDDPGGPLLGLTARESDVLREMATGRTNAQIAQTLHISEGTVKTHVKSVLRKLDAANRADAVARYYRTTTSGRPTLVH